MASRKLLIRGVLAALLVSLLAGGAEGAGPWKGQIVDRETGQPIAGAVVLAIWTVRSWGEIHPHDEFHSAFEAVSDADGRFVIPEHTAVPTKPLTAIRGPQIVIFKAGFGGWAFQGGPYYPGTEDHHTAEQRIKRAWEAFAKGGAVFELRGAADRQQRLHWNGSVRPLDVPDDHMPQLLWALDAELVALGMQPYHVPKGRHQ
jgi:hypothetical protein